MPIGHKTIISYIEFLKQAGFTVTLHGEGINRSVFMEYNYHRNPYCHYIKSVYGKWNECICRQANIFANRDSSFFGCCYAGVGEYVYPIKREDKIVGFVSVSGYAAEDSASKSEHFARKHGISAEDLQGLLDRYLNKTLPSKADVDAAIDPLVFMLESYFREASEEIGDEDSLYHKMLRYITENYHSRIKMAELSDRFNYSVSTLSHVFMKHSGRSLPAYIDDMRIEESKWYLQNSSTKVSEIAYFLGYGSSNYFSAAFKRKTGMTPREWRSSYS